MRAQQIRKFDMLRRVRQFLDAFAVRLADVNATSARQELDEIVREMGVQRELAGHEHVEREGRDGDASGFCVAIS